MEEDFGNKVLFFQKITICSLLFTHYHSSSIFFNFFHPFFMRFKERINFHNNDDMIRSKSYSETTSLVNRPK